MQYFSIKKEEWDKNLSNLTLSHIIFATVNNGSGQDYELIESNNIGEITYNDPKPATPLKSFFLPVKENVTSGKKPSKTAIIIGPPNCDIEALKLLDLIYLGNDYEDMYYRARRENTLLISSDCLSVNEHCHCTSYGLKPYAMRIADIALTLVNDTVILRSISVKGEAFINQLNGIRTGIDGTYIEAVETGHQRTEEKLMSLNGSLPGYEETGALMRIDGDNIWDKYSSRCVSCGACSAICPTCSCFILIDKPGFEKVKQMDSCQYPGFERVAGGEDALHELQKRFMNRYMCKYVWKPQKFEAVACTGCGRCIETCLGKINKNDIFRELSMLHNNA